MTAIALLTTLRSAGAVVVVNGDRLEIDAPETVLTDDVVDQLRHHKPVLLKLLAKPAWRCRCGSVAWIDVVLRHDPHFGTSTRRDCARCNRFVSFPVWYGRPSEN